MNRSFFETIIGALIIVFAISFSYYAYNKAEKNLSKSYFVTAKFDRVDGINIGSEVKISGIKVGTVTSREIDGNDYRAIIGMSIMENIKLPKDSSAQILSESLLGQKFINIMPGADDQFIEGGGEIEYTQSSINIEDLIGKMMFSKDDKNK